MANELQAKHKTVGTAITQTEFEAADSHNLIIDSGVVGDILVGATSAGDVIPQRLAIGANKKILKSNGTTLVYDDNDTLTNAAGTDVVYIPAAAATVGINTSTPDSTLEVLSTTTQLRLTHTDATDYATMGVDGNGLLTITTVDGGGAAGHISIVPDGNVIIGSGTPASKLCVDGGLHVGGTANAGDNNLLVDGNINVGATVRNCYKNQIDGAFASGGYSTVVAGLTVGTQLTGAAGDTSWQSIIAAGTGVGSTITTQASETVEYVSTVYLAEPAITVGAGGTVTNSAILLLGPPATEATNNYVILAQGGKCQFGTEKYSTGLTPPLITDQTAQTVDTNAIVNGRFARHGERIAETYHLKMNEATGATAFVDKNNHLTLPLGFGSTAYTNTTFGPLDYTQPAVSYGSTGASSDCSISGNYLGTGRKTYKLFLHDVATGEETGDVFTYSINGGTQSGHIIIDGTAQLLEDGLYVTWAALLGHTLNDSWTFNVSIPTGLTGVHHSIKSTGYFTQLKNIKATGDWSLSFWERTLGYRGNTTAAYSFIYALSASPVVNGLSFYHVLYTTMCLGILNQAAAATTYIKARATEDYLFHLYTFTRHGDTITLYVDGAYSNAVTDPDNDRDWSGTIIFNTSNTLLDFQHADFRFYNECLDAKDIADIYASGAGTYRSLQTTRRPYYLDASGYSNFDNGLISNGELVVDGQLILTPQAAPTGAEGLVYYDTTANKLKFYNGATWETITSA